MEQNYALQKQAKLEEVQAKIDLFGSQQRKDSAETIQKMKDRLYSTQLKAAEFDVDNIKELNKYNQDQAKSTLERLDNLKAISDGIIASSTPLTEEQKQQASVI
jgi:G3E family GTPase